jgi:hypothetical protein
LRTFSLDLHVLGTPPAFVLSQDQTLQLSSWCWYFFASRPPARGTVASCTQSIARLPQSLRGSALRFSKTRRLHDFVPRTTDSFRSPCSSDGGALPTASRNQCQEPRFRPLPQAPRTSQGAAYLARRRTSVKRTKSDAGGARKIRRCGRFSRLLADQVDLLRAPRDARLRPHHPRLGKRLLAAP